MKFLALAALLLSLNAHATNGFDCTGYKADGKKVELFGTTGRVPGNPLVSDLTMTVGNIEIAQVIPRNLVVGYWNMGRDLRVAAVDANAENMVLKLRAKLRRNSHIAKGKLTLANGEKIKVKCIME